jgi:hypothetical protein
VLFKILDPFTIKKLAVSNIFSFSITGGCVSLLQSVNFISWFLLFVHLCFLVYVCMYVYMYV